MPWLAAEVQGCDVHLFFQDQSVNEIGYFIYRATNNETSLLRIASLAAYDQDVLLEYIDPGQSGLLTYVVAAYNTAGEVQSNPVSVAVFDPACSGLDPLAWLLDTFPLPSPEPVVPAIPDGTPTPTAVPPAGFTPLQNANCRSGPAAEFPVLAFLTADVSMPVEARTLDGTWLAVQPPGGLRCWVWREMGWLTGDLDNLPIESGPPLPGGITQSAPSSGSGPTRTPCPLSHVCPTP